MPTVAQPRQERQRRPDSERPKHVSGFEVVVVLLALVGNLLLARAILNFPDPPMNDSGGPGWAMELMELVALCFAFGVFVAVLSVLPLVRGHARLAGLTVALAGLPSVFCYFAL